MKRTSLLRSALLGLALLAGSSASATVQESAPGTGSTWWVDASGAGLGTGTSSDPFTNISYGVSRSFVSSGDTLVVAPGTYNDEEIDFLGKSLHLLSSGGPEVTTIVARPQTDPFIPHSAARIVSGELLVEIEGFRLTGGTGSLECSGFTTVVGGAIEVCGDSTLTVRNCVFAGNRAERGGAIFAENAHLRVEDCDFTGPGTEARGEAIYLSHSSAVVEDSSFTDLFLVSPSVPRGGSAVVADQSTLLLERCDFERNATRFFGAHLWSRSGHVTVNRCVFGQATGLAGAAIAASNGTLQIFASTVRSARAIQAPGAGIFGSNADVLIRGSLFQSNFVDGTREGGAVAVQAGRLTVEDSRFVRNVAGQGGAIATSQSANTVIQGCRFLGNAAVNGGGGAVYLADTFATIKRSAFLDNVATPTGSGGAVLGRAALNQCSFAGNAGGVDGGAASGGAQLFRSIAWGNSPTDLDPTVIAIESMVGAANGATLQRPVLGPPLFWSDEDLRLLPGSPAIDAVTGSEGLDADGSAMELGAYVFDPSYCPDDLELGLGTFGCESEPNSTGEIAELQARGSLLIDADRLVLLNTQVPPAAPTLMLASLSDGYLTVPNMLGPLCLGSPFLRLMDLQSSSRLDGTVPTWVPLFRGSGLLREGPPKEGLLNSGLFVQPGETWFFQLWFRDSLGATATNTSNSVQVTLR